MNWNESQDVAESNRYEIKKLSEAESKDFWLKKGLTTWYGHDKNCSSAARLDGEPLQLMFHDSYMIVSVCKKCGKTTM